MTFLFRQPGSEWTKERSFEVSGDNHNVADGVLSHRPGVYAAGLGKAIIRSLRYQALD